jgi:hypothetical protein
MKKYLLVLFLIVVVSGLNSFAQKITFKLINAATLQPIEGASLKSFLDSSLHLKSDVFGHFTVQLKENDTLTISKEYYHPLYLFVKAKNFDSTHVVSINMLPSKEIHEPIKSNFKSLSDFDYHFVHDKVGDDSHLKIVGFEHKTAADVRNDMLHTTKDPNGLHITPVLHHKYKGESLYKLKE